MPAFDGSHTLMGHSLGPAHDGDPNPVHDGDSKFRETGSKYPY